MTHYIRNTVCRLGGEADGAEVAEAAAVLPIMFMMILGIFWFGQAFSIYTTITRAAQEGARAGAAQVCTTCAAGSATPDTNAFNAVQAVLVAAKLDPTKLQKPSTVPSLTSCNGGPVTCDAAPTNMCVQQNIQLSSSTSNVCGISVSLQYPYQFWLPFTSLNKQLINLRAAASVRQESM